jgi:hypothetical protein
VALIFSVADVLGLIFGYGRLYRLGLLAMPALLFPRERGWQLWLWTEAIGHRLDGGFL